MTGLPRRWRGGVGVAQMVADGDLCPDCIKDVEASGAEWWQF